MGILVQVLLGSFNRDLYFRLGRRGEVVLWMYGLGGGECSEVF